MLNFSSYVIARMKSSKILVLPSTREGFGMVVFEAFACGVPVITVKAERNAAWELVSEKTGFVVNLDARELGNAISKLITDNALRESMSKSAIDAVQEFDWNNTARQLTRLYEELIRESRA